MTLEDEVRDLRTRMAAAETRLDQAEVHFEFIAGQLRAIQNTLVRHDGKFEQIAGQFKAVQLQIDTRFAETDQKIERLENKFERLEGKFDQLRDDLPGIVAEAVSGVLRDKS